MPIDERSLVSIGPFPAGSNNIALETSVPARAARRVVNADFNDDGKIQRRQGRTKVFGAVEPHSLWGFGDRGFFAMGTRLYAFTVADGYPTPPVELTNQLSPDAPLTFTVIEPDIFVSDGQSNYRIGLDNSFSDWSVPTAEQPGLFEVQGSLPAGRYMVAVALKNDTGEEGPLSLHSTIEVGDNAGIEVNVRAWGDPKLRTVIYMTKPNGTELLFAASMPASASSKVFLKQNLGRAPVTQHTDPMPAGRFSAIWNGRLLVAVGNIVYWSEPLQYGVTNLSYNYRVFSDTVTMLAAIDTAGGFFVGQGKHTYFVSGADPSDARLVSAYAFGVVPGTQTMVPGARLPFDVPPVMPVPMWLASNGVFCVGMLDGTVQPLTETRYAAQHADAGAVMFDQRAGKNRYVATLRNPSDNNFAMSDQFTAEVVRRNNIPSED